MSMSEPCRELFAFPVTGEKEPADATETQNCIPLHLQPRSFTKTEHQWPDLTLSLFSFPRLSGHTVGVSVFLCHPKVQVHGLTSQIGLPPCSSSSPFDSAVTLTSAEDCRAATEINSIKQPQIYSSRWNYKTFQQLKA